METIEATLSIELNVECPNCEHYFDLFEYEEGRLNEEGQLIMSACPNGIWSEEHEHFKEKIDCPECHQEINIEGIAW